MKPLLFSLASDGDFFTVIIRDNSRRIQHSWAFSPRTGNLLCVLPLLCVHVHMYACSPFCGSLLRGTQSFLCDRDSRLQNSWMVVDRSLCFALWERETLWFTALRPTICSLMAITKKHDEHKVCFLLTLSIVSPPFLCQNTRVLHCDIQEKRSNARHSFRDVLKKLFPTYSVFCVHVLSGSDRRLSCMEELSRATLFSDDFNTSVAAWWIGGGLKRAEIIVFDKTIALYVLSSEGHQTYEARQRSISHSHLGQQHLCKSLLKGSWISEFVRPWGGGGRMQKFALSK